MYNRYIPQPDGSFRRDRMEEAKPRNQTPKSCPPPMPVKSPEPPDSYPPPPPAPPCQNNDVKQIPCQKTPPKQPPCMRPQSKEPGGIGSFFKQLLPKDLDTADLLIIILLLLMAGDKEEDQTNALLTLALYFFM